MSADWTPEELATISAAHLGCVRLCQARQAPRATTETRIALVAFERGISDRQLEQFYYVNRKGATKRHFNHEAFAKKYDVDIRWIWEGDLCKHPRMPAPPREKKQPRQKTAPTFEEFRLLVAQLPSEFYPALLAQMRHLADGGAA